jgi:hypothetical protein
LIFWARKKNEPCISGRLALYNFSIDHSVNQKAEPLASRNPFPAIGEGWMGIIYNNTIAASRTMHEMQITRTDPKPSHTDALLSAPAALLVVSLLSSPEVVPDPISTVEVAVAAASKSDSWCKSVSTLTAWSPRYSDSSSASNVVGTGIVSEKVAVGELNTVTPVVLPLVYVYVVFAYW